MSSGRETDPPDDAGIGELLRKVGARDEPSADLAHEVQAAVHAEWLAVVRERRKRRLIASWGVAAGFALVVASATLSWRILQPQPIPIATVERIDGHLLADAGDDRWAGRNTGQPLSLGETLRTDDRSRAAIAFGHGLSLRLDRNTTLRLASADRIVLGSGALYVDSPADAPAADSTLTVEAHVGSVRHIGTQYQVRTHADTLEVSVREGRVEITGAAGSNTGKAGETVRMTANGDVTRATLSPQDPAWQWVVSAAPVFDINDRPLSSFLDWVARETGRKVIYSSAQAQAAAGEVRLRGSTAGLDPDNALTAVLSTTRLRRYDTDTGSIGITLAPTDSSQPQRQIP